MKSDLGYRRHERARAWGRVAPSPVLAALSVALLLTPTGCWGGKKLRLQEERIRQLTLVRDRSQAALREALDQNDTLIGELRVLQAQRDSLRDQGEATTHQIRVLNERLRLAEAEIGEREQKISGLQGELDRALGERKTLQDDADTARRTAAGLEAKVAEMAKGYEGLVEGNRVLKKRVAALETEKRDLGETLARTDGRVVELEEQLRLHAAALAARPARGTERSAPPPPAAAVAVPATVATAPWEQVKSIAVAKWQDALAGRFAFDGVDKITLGVVAVFVLLVGLWLSASVRVRRLRRAMASFPDLAGPADDLEDLYGGPAAETETLEGVGDTALEGLVPSIPDGALDPVDSIEDEPVDRTQDADADQMSEQEEPAMVAQMERSQPPARPGGKTIGDDLARTQVISEEKRAEGYVKAAPKTERPSGEPAPSGDLLAELKAAINEKFERLLKS